MRRSSVILFAFGCGEETGAPVFSPTSAPGEVPAPEGNTYTGIGIDPNRDSYFTTGGEYSSGDNNPIARGNPSTVARTATPTPTHATSLVKAW